VRSFNSRGYGLRAASVKVVLSRGQGPLEPFAVPRTSSSTPRLRAAPLAKPLHVVLVEPEIPPNTGNVARLCAATASPMHLVGTLGFRIDDHSVRRAGVDYWHLVDVRQHIDFEHFLHAWSKQVPGGKLHLFSATATRSYLDAGYAPGDALVFGRESVGLSEELLARFPDRTVGIPTLGAVRSLNLANAVGIALYEALRSVGALASPYTG
jgi:tRNA (cytidine/uridine-2'-O-)-methyltransferase